MRDRRAAAAVLTTLLLLVSPCLPAHGDPTSPTPAERRAAQKRVAAAQRSVTALQARAEQAIEYYNGRLTLVRKADAARRTALVRAESSRTAYRTAAAAAADAQSRADQATVEASFADATRDGAQADAEASQTTLDAMAAGAFRSGGQIGMLSQLMLADDPLELANGRNLIIQVTDYQQQIITEMTAARDRAAQAAKRAAASRTRADQSAAAASRALTASHRAKDETDAAHRDAAATALAAHAALADANRARTNAEHAIARAESVLHRAVRTAASLERAAAAARREAARLSRSKAPSEAAEIAISWAYKQVGTPYAWGGGDESGPTRGFGRGARTVGFDCSGLTLFAYAKAGIHLDHYTGSQWDQGMRISSRKDLLPGDLMFFATDTSQPATIHHVAIYLGQDRMLEAPYTGEVVGVSSAMRDDFIGGTRPWA